MLTPKRGPWRVTGHATPIMPLRHELLWAKGTLKVADASRPVLIFPFLLGNTRLNLPLKWKMSSLYRKETNIFIIKNEKLRLRELYKTDLVKIILVFLWHPHRVYLLLQSLLFAQRAGFAISLGLYSLWRFLCNVKNINLCVFLQLLCLKSV